MSQPLRAHAVGTGQGAPATGVVVMHAAAQVDLERRFGGLRRLFGDAGYQRLRAARVAVVGLGGVGSWAAEALARSGVAGLVLIDLDQVSESNINRQVQALGSTAGMAKVQALARRIADIHPGCALRLVEEFADAQNWPALLGGPVDAVIDACDQGHAKLAIAQWALHKAVPLVVAGAAGGKQQPQAVEVADLAEATHDPLLAALRQRLRKAGAARQGRMGLRCVFSREAVVAPAAGDCSTDRSSDGSTDSSIDSGTDRSIDRSINSSIDSSLNCHGFGSVVTVTATFGMVAAGEVMRLLLARAAAPRA